MALFGKKPRATGQAMDLRPNGNLQQPLPQPQQQPKKRSVLPYVLAAAEDTLSRQMGYQPQGVARLNERQQEAQDRAEALRQASLKRDTDWQDWVRKQEYERANPAPVNNDTVADYEFIRQNLGDEAAAEFLKNKANPPQYRQGPDGAFYRIDTSGTAPPTKPVGRLTPIGGDAGGNASGGFRP